MNHKIKNAFCTCLSIFASFFLRANRTIEMENMNYFYLKVIANPDNQRCLAKLKCNLSGSSVVINKIKIKKNGAKLILLLNSSITRPNKSSTIEYDFSLSDSIDLIVFGKKERVVWSKENSGEFFYPSIEVVNHFKNLNNSPSEW